MAIGFYPMWFSIKHTLAFWLLVAPYAYGTPVLSEQCDQLFTRRDIIPALPEKRLPRQLTEQELTTHVIEKISSVAEFKEIRELAQSLGIRVWLFGGTASSFLHYVQWDLKLQNGRFDYDFTNIFRSTQDIDIVVDATPEVALQFQKILSDQFPYFLGKKSNDWEVRTLRYPMNHPGDPDYKEALLGDPHFKNQNTDSHSIGMIEITSSKNEPVIRDLKNWNAKTSLFLKDAVQNQIHFLRSDQHFNTPRAIRGENPEILSVLRVLVKAFQYELHLSPQDIAEIRKIVAAFNPHEITNRTALRRIQSTSQKLIVHAINLEYAFDTLDQLGLRKKLISMGNPTLVGSPAWWLYREPLRSFPLGQGWGNTAEHLGLDIVAHETSDFQAYESIVRSPLGSPNVLISRQSVSSEIALMGDGFYVSTGMTGARGTGITIRFHLDPKAREGTDFNIHQRSSRSGNYLLIKNKNALKVIPESLEMSPSEYFEFLTQGKDFPSDDRALLWKLQRKIQNRLTSKIEDPREIKKVESIILEQLKTNSPHHQRVFAEWLRILDTKFKKDSQIYLSLLKETYRADPAPLLDKILLLTRGTEMESWIQENYIPNLLNNLKKDIGNNAIQNALFSVNPVIQEFGHQALAQALHQKPTPELLALKNIIHEKRSNEVDLNPAITRWLNSNSTSLPHLIEEKAAFISFQPLNQDWLQSVPTHELEGVSKKLSEKSFSILFEKLAEKQEKAVQNLFLSQAKPESFRWIHFDIPKEGTKFWMGSPDSGRDKWDTNPYQEVILTESFQLQSTPLTEFQKTLLLGGDLLKIAPIGNRPATYLSWNDTQKLVAILNQIDPNYLYRLPYEKEWEYAARAGTLTTFSFGDNPDEISDYAVYIGNSRGSAQDVASRKPNPAGLYDVHGNVWEWCQDLLSLGEYRVMRGGSWGLEARSMRTSRSYMNQPWTSLPGTGVRLLRIPR